MMPQVYEVNVESSVPGRMRLRLPREHRRQDVMSKISVTLNGTSGIHSVMVNPATGSILVENDPNLIDTEMLLKAIHAKHAAPTNEAQWDFLAKQPWPGKSKAGLHIIRSFRKFDQTVSWVTKGAVDGKLTIVMMLLVLSLGRAFLADKRTAAPWYSLLWYSYSMFMHWYNPTRNEQIMRIN